MEVNFANIFGIGIILLGLYVVLQYFKIKTIRLPFFNWWNAWKDVSSNDQTIEGFTGADVVENNNLINWYYIYSYRDSKLVNTFLSMTVADTSQLKESFCTFLIDETPRYQTYGTPSSGVYGGLLTPRSYSTSLCPATGFGDYIFDLWVPDYGNQLHPNVGFDETSYLTYNAANNPPTRSSNGIYPSVDSTEDWKYLILEWLNGWDIKNNRYKNDSWEITTVDGKNLPTLKQGATDPGYWLNWNNTGLPRPDNFFARLGMQGNATLIAILLTGTFFWDDGTRPSSVFAVKKLLGQGSEGVTLSGLFGFLKSIEGEADESVGKIEDLLFTAPALDSPLASPESCTDAEKRSAGIAGALSTSIPMAGIALMVPVLGEGVLAAVAAASIVGSAGWLGYRSYNESADACQKS